MRTSKEIMVDLLAALSRQGTELDGNWGYPSSRSEFARLYDELKRSNAAGEVSPTKGE